jgi:hypothetical protein
VNLDAKVAKIEQGHQHSLEHGDRDCVPDDATPLGGFDLVWFPDPTFSPTGRNI